MRVILMLTLAMIFGLNSLQAQEKDLYWAAKLSTDSLLMGNRLKVTFTLKNGEGRNFQPPSFEGFQIIGGPNQSSSMSIVNGNMSREASYSFVLTPVGEGTYFIEPAVIYVDGTAMETPPLEIIVFPNPDGIQQEVPRESLEWNKLPWSKPEAPRLDGKKKRKIYRI